MLILERWDIFGFGTSSKSVDYHIRQYDYGNLN